MKCKNCNHNTSRVLMHIKNNFYSKKIKFVKDNKNYFCFNPKVDCKHLEDTRIRSDLLIIQHTSSGKNFDGLYRAVWEQLKEHCKFCPFCGEELK